MAAMEIESFVTKYKHLCSVGIAATLVFECHGGETVVTFKANLGCCAQPPGVNSAHFRNPSYGRRQLRRQATRLKTEPIVDNEAEKASSLSDDVDFRRKTEDNEAVEATALNEIDLKKAEKPQETVVVQDSSTEKLAAKVCFTESKFKCEECDFEALSSIKLKIHLRCEHAKVKNGSFQHETALKEKYESTKHYWKTGRIGISYQSFIEAIFVIKACLPQYQQVMEMDLLYEARKKLLGTNYFTYPPWCNK